MHRLGEDAEADRQALRDWARSVQTAVRTGDDGKPSIIVAFPIDGLTDAEIEQRSDMLRELVMLMAEFYEEETGDRLDIRKEFSLRFPPNDRP